MIKYGQFTEFLSLNKYDLIALYASCMVHDYKHPGYNNAFLAVHTLKGISGNLSLDDFFNSVCVLTEILRNYNGEDFSKALLEVETKYNDIIEKINLIEK